MRTLVKLHCRRNDYKPEFSLQCLCRGSDRFYIVEYVGIDNDSDDPLDYVAFKSFASALDFINTNLLTLYVNDTNSKVTD